ncbi:MAG TPA: NADH-quinone oxidoreductase subunit N [Acidimicrobiales bacterium]|jgi:NADH-quinone oxidoreductase subunit N|nr:NADH-quinone oxidoreductase subunit N [Acidimicrobiales bacterium]
MSPLGLLAASSSATPTIHVPHVDYLSILPMLIMMGGALALMVASSLFRKILTVGVGTWVASAVSVAALVAGLFQWDQISTHGAQVTVAGAIAFDGFDVFIQIVVAMAMLLTALIGDGYLRREGVEGPEFHVLAMMSASGAMMMGAANDLIVIFLGLEILSIALYVLAAFNHKRAESGEAALKYFVLGAFSSAVFVYGIALTYGATGSTNLPQIADYLSRNVIASNGVLLGGLALLLVGFGFKIAAVPFHMWSPDVYQGSPSPVTGFMAAVAKAGAFAALLRVFVSSFATARTDWQPIIWGLAILSLVVGATVALMQRDVKRMMAYSSINHAGFILLGVEAATTRGVAASLYYLITYMFLVIGSFAVITVMSRPGDTGHQISDYRGLARRQPLLALAFAVLLLGQAGVPFTTGFLAKFEVVAAAEATRAYVLAAIAMVSAAVAAFFYLRVAVTMFSPVGSVGDLVDGADSAGGGGRADDRAGDGGIGDDRAGDGPGAPTSGGAGAPVSSLQVLTDAPPLESVTERGPVAVPTLTWLAIGLSVGFTVVFGIIPGPILDFAHQATLLFA